MDGLAAGVKTGVGGLAAGDGGARLGAVAAVPGVLEGVLENEVFLGEGVRGGGIGREGVGCGEGVGGGVGVRSDGVGGDGGCEGRGIAEGILEDAWSRCK